VERLEIAKLGVGLEAIKGLCDAVQRCLAEPLGLGKVGEVCALDALVLGVMSFHEVELRGWSHISRRGRRSLL
jgi:hypothetical protein